MFPTFQYSEIEFLGFILVLIRMTSFTVSWPVFGVSTVPNPAKVLFALILSMILFPVVNIDGIREAALSHQMVWLILREIFIGLSIGYLGRMFFYAVSAAGNLVSTSMGLSSAQIFNPTVGSQGNAIEQFQTIFATLFFLAINGHHFMLTGLAKSFELLPLSPSGLEVIVSRDIALIGKDVLIATVKISAPVMVSILILNVGMGIVGRAVPQINVLITSLPVNILVGFLILIVSIPLFLMEMNGLFEHFAESLFKVMKAW